MRRFRVAPTHSVIRFSVLAAATIAAAGLVSLCHAEPRTGNAEPPAIEAAAAILVDAQNGQVLYEKNADVRRPPASTTKILTAVLLLENVDLNTPIAADKQSSETDGSSLYMLPGERIVARELLYGIMLRSANDACVAVAKHIAGSEAAFADMMNAKAAELGATNSHFSNPNGLHAPDHYSTARDLATIARYAMGLDTFREVVATRYHTIVRDPRNKDTFIKSRAKWLWHYPGADGIKTGYTVPAGRCFVGSATRKGWRLISVVLNSPDIFGETRKLMDYGFAAFEPVEAAVPRNFVVRVPVEHGRASSVQAAAVRRVRVVVPRGRTPELEYEPRTTQLQAPVAVGTEVGELTVRLAGDRQASGIGDAGASGAVVDRIALVTVSAVERVPDSPPAGSAWPRAVASIIALGVFWYGSATSKGSGRIGHRLTSSK